MRKHRLLRVFLGPTASVVFLSLLAVGLGASPVAAEFFAYVLAASKSDRTRFVHMICGDKFPRALRSPPLIKGEGDVASGGTRRCTNVMWFDLVAMS